MRSKRSSRPGSKHWRRPWPAPSSAPSTPRTAWRWRQPWPDPRSELDAARALIDLLEDALGGPAVRVDLLELVRSAARSTERAEGDGAAATRATLAAPSRQHRATGQPAVGDVAARDWSSTDGRRDEPDHPARCRLTAAEGECGLRVEHGPGEGESMSLVSRVLIAPSLPCARRGGAAGRSASRARRERLHDSLAVIGLSALWLATAHTHRYAARHDRSRAQKSHRGGLRRSRAA